MGGDQYWTWAQGGSDFIPTLLHERIEYSKRLGVMNPDISSLQAVDRGYKVISSSSLTYVLTHAPVGECRTILSSIFRYIKSGSALRIWQDGEGRKETWLKLLPLLQEFYREGIISNYSTIPTDVDILGL